ncbi:MAG: hypothetical protein ACMXYG_04855 [Candidatus Woesearchaeota archaeon]
MNKGIYYTKNKIKSLHKIETIIMVILLINLKNVYAIPASSIIPFIGPIIAQIAILMSGAFFFMMAKFTKYKTIFLIIGIILLIIFLIIWLL